MRNLLSIFFLFAQTQHTEKTVSELLTHTTATQNYLVELNIDLVIFR